MEKILSHEQVKYPEKLSNKDIELIERQCRIQNANSKEQVEGFARAYLHVKEIALDKEYLARLDEEDIERLILEVAQMVEPINEKGYRLVPVTFANGTRALEPQKIPQAMKGYGFGILQYLEDPREDEKFNSTLMYKNFEEIHPFEDGNGRVGDLLWKMMETRKTGKWADELPPDVFNENN